MFRNTSKFVNAKCATYFTEQIFKEVKLEKSIEQMYLWVSDNLHGLRYQYIQLYILKKQLHIQWSLIFEQIEQCKQFKSLKLTSQYLQSVLQIPVTI